MTKHIDNDNPNQEKNSRLNSLTFTEGKTQLPMKNNKRCVILSWQPMTMN